MAEVAGVKRPKPRQNVCGTVLSLPTGRPSEGLCGTPRSDGDAGCCMCLRFSVVTKGHCHVTARFSPRLDTSNFFDLSLIPSHTQIRRQL